MDVREGGEGRGGKGGGDRKGQDHNQDAIDMSTYWVLN